MKKETAIQILKAFKAEYDERFEVSQDRINIWCRVLADVPDRPAIAAMMQILGENRKFPPTCGELRVQALNLSRGLIEKPSGVSAWEKVAAKINGQNVKLSEDENRALKATGKDMHMLKRSNNLASDRAVFIKIFDEFQTVAEQKLTTPPEVKQFLGAINNKQLTEGDKNGM